MAALLQSLTFVYPWLLVALATLPVLWWLLRVLPPSPKLIAFPAIRLLFGLETDQRTPDKAPWWLVLLRLLTAALAIFALSQPVLNPRATVIGSGPLILVIDDGWAAAPDWRSRIETLTELLQDARRNDRTVRLLTTAPGYDGSPPQDRGTLRPEDARAVIDGLEPKPWPADRMQAVSIVRGWTIEGAASSYWASDGLDSDGAPELAETLQRLGTLTVFEPNQAQRPVVLEPPAPGSLGFEFTLHRLATDSEERVDILAIGSDGRTVGRSAGLFAGGSSETSADFDLPIELRNEISQVRLERRDGAAGVALLDTRWARRPIGLVATSELDAGLSLLSESFYIRRALEPFGSFSQGPVDVLLKAGQSVILVPDTAVLSETEVAELQEWTATGGILVRFAGTSLAQAENPPLVPVELRKGGRALGGAMLWTKPLGLAARFPEDGPFDGLAVPDDVVVKQQVLAEPGPSLDSKTWARLSDGTPLITAESRGEGWLILFHTTANAEWSNLTLSGVFVSLLERIVQLGQGQTTAADAPAKLSPDTTLNGYGRLGDPSSAAIAADFNAPEPIVIGPRHPPGIYGATGEKRALNLGPQVSQLAGLDSLPASVTRTPYGLARQVDLKPALLLAALVLLIIDGVVTLILRGFAPKIGKRTAPATAVAAVLIFGVSGMPSPGHAQTVNGEDLTLDALQGTVLAYVITGNDEIDRTSHAGLVGLASILNQRTAVEASQPVGVDLARDEIAFFPLLYWPVTATQPPPNSVVADKLNRFMATGGTIFLDTREQPVGGASVRMTNNLRRLSIRLELPALTNIPPGHVLTKSFYLMQEFPGRWNGGEVWVEPEGQTANDGVSRMIVGTNDWAAAWAVDELGQPIYPTVPGGERQREMAYRFGVNLVMYTLTGNYKADQVHVPAILERLGQ
ncbi:MAG: DUF4159 domain-containing protein [Alphaproteobacteria bacterium]